MLFGIIHNASAYTRLSYKSINWLIEAFLHSMLWCKTSRDSESKDFQSWWEGL